MTIPVNVSKVTDGIAQCEVNSKNIIYPYRSQVTACPTLSSLNLGPFALESQKTTPELLSAVLRNIVRCLCVLYFTNMLCKLYCLHKTLFRRKHKLLLSQYL